jgi:arylsulfatase A-like enzyme
VAFLDRNVGRVLDALHRLRLEEDTFVVYTADHGYNLGQHGRFEKHCGYEPALRVPATIVDVMRLDPLPVTHGQSLRPYLEGRRPPHRRDHIFSEYLENEEAYITTFEWKYILCSGKRARQDGYEIEVATPVRYRRLYDLRNDPGEFTDVASKHPDLITKFDGLLLDRFRATHPDREMEPQGLNREEAIDFYLRPRDAASGFRA